MSQTSIDERLPIDAGTVLSNRFRIIRRLGVGGFGEVYLAEQLLLGRAFRKVGLKLFFEGVVSAANAHEVLNDALIVLALLEESPPVEVSRRLVEVYDIGMLEAPVQRAYMSMRLVPSAKTLASEVYRFRYGGGMPVALSLRYMRELLLPLAWMHSLDSPAVHGDLKPENVMLTGDARLVLIDFGLAARMPVGVRGGTLAYDAPEKLRGNLGDESSDVYSVGLIWYELLTGRHPFADVGREATARGDVEGYTHAQLAAREWPICAREALHVGAQEQRIAPASEVNADLALHPQLELILNKCLAVKREERFPNARVLSDALTRYVEGQSVETFTQQDRDVIGQSRQAPTPADSVPVTSPATPERKLADAKALIAHGTYDRALALVNEVLRQEPRSVSALMIKASALLEMPGQLSAADEACGQAVALDRQNPAAFRVLANIRDKQGKATQAAAFRKTALELEHAPRRPGRST